MTSEELLPKAVSQVTIKHQVKSVGSKINRGCSFIIYCDPGIGKTTMATTLPVGETLFINAEAGLGPLLGSGHDVFPKDGYDVHWLEDLESVYTWLRTDKHKYKNVVLDNISDIEQRLIHELTEKRHKETPELREYGDVAFKIREHCSNFRDLVHIGMNVVFNAWENTESIKTDAGSVVTRTYPKLSHKVAIEICGKVDVVGHLEVHEKSGKRWVRFGPSDQYITKSQFLGLDSGEPADFPLLLQKIYAYDYKTRI